MAKDVIADLEARISTNLEEFKRQMNQSAEVVRTSTATMGRYLDGARTGFGKVSDAVGTFLKSAGMVAGVATAAGVGVFYLVERQIQLADSIAKTADRLKLTTDELQIYQKVADLAGVSNEQFAKGMQAFTKTVGELQVGTGTLNAYLDKTNLALKEQLTNAGSVGEGYQIIMDALGEMEPGFQQNALAMAAFGKAGAAMTVMVKDGAAANQQMIQTVKELGIVIDEELLRNAEIASDKLSDLKDVIGVQMTSAALQLAPAITKISSELLLWIKNNQTLIDQKVDEYIGKFVTAIENFDSQKIIGGLDAIFTGITTVASAYEGWSMIIDVLKGDYDSLVVKANAGSDSLKRDIGLVEIELSKAREQLERFKAMTDIEYKIAVALGSGTIEEIETEINGLETKLKGLQDRKTEIEIKANTQDASNHLDELQGKIDEIKEPPPLTITADTDPAVAEILLIKERMDKGTYNAAIEVDANLQPARNGIERLFFEMDGKQMYIDVQANTQPAESETDKYLKQVENMKAEVLLGADPKEALSELKKLKDKIELEKALVTLGADPTMAIDEVRKLEEQIQSIEAAIKVVADAQEAEQVVDEFRNEVENNPATIIIEADTEPAMEAIEEVRREAGRPLPTIEKIDELLKGIVEKKKENIELTNMEIMQYRMLLMYKSEYAKGGFGGETIEIPKFGTGTGLAGLDRDRMVYAHKGEIILNPQESDMFRGVSKGVDPMRFLPELANQLQPYRMPTTAPAISNSTQSTRNEYINISVNPSSIGRQFMTAQEAAEAMVREINYRKVRIGALN